MTDVAIGIPQDSPVSPILFLIYTRFLYSERSNTSERMLSYVDDIDLTVTSNSIEENCQLLQRLAADLITEQDQNCIKFDVDKIELIHFHFKRHLDLENELYSVKIGDTVFQPKEVVKYLGVWLDSKLSFKTHVEKKIASAKKLLMQIERLSNTEKDLTFQAMRQLYMACISSVADYGVPVWWNNQQHLLEKFQKLQNQALRKILGVFKTSPVSAMEIEASLPPCKVRFNKICKNYALRMLQMHEQHPIRLRVSSGYPPFENGIDLDWTKFLDWNETEATETSYIQTDSDSDLPLESSVRRRRKRKRRKTSKKKQVSQLFRITASIADLLPSLKIEEISHKDNMPWKECLNSLIDIRISELSKEKEANQHKNQIQNLIKYQNVNNLIIYSDGSKNEQTGNLGAGVFCTKNFSMENSKSLSWNLGPHMEVFDAELFAMAKAFKLAHNQISFFTKDIWIFSDSQAAIQRLQNSSLKAGQKYVLAIEDWIAKIKMKHQINIHVGWVPGHMNITGNEKADQAAKRGTELQKTCAEKHVSLAFIKRKIRESALIEWEKEYAKSNKGKFYSQFECAPRWKTYKKTVKKKVWSAFMQLKMGHGYFKSYLVRMPEYSTNRCFICGTKENPEHLILHCKSTQAVREELKQEFEIKEFSLKNLFNTNIGQKFLFEFIEKTQVSTRNWLLQQVSLEAEEEEE